MDCLDLSPKDGMFKHILLAGSTGYLGSYIAKELKRRGYRVTLIVRSHKKLDRDIQADKAIEGDLSDSEIYEKAFDGVDAVISTIGITKQKDNLSYMDVDFKINHLLLENAQKHKIKKFVYVSVLHAQHLRDVAICSAKEKFVDELLQSNIDATVIRPSGFFSDMGEFYQMAKSGRVYLFGDGSIKANPIHGADLANVCVDALKLIDQVIEVGGPEVLTHNQMAQDAFEVVGKRAKILYIPHWFRKVLLKVLPIFMSKNSFGPVEFFLHVMAMDMSAPRYGKLKLKEYFRYLSTQKNQ
jgi:uncharacterized protein YbjT (DUF2867 family)